MWPCSSACTWISSGICSRYTPVAIVCGTCGPEVGGSELYGACGAPTEGVWGPGRTGTAWPGPVTLLLASAVVWARQVTVARPTANVASAQSTTSLRNVSFMRAPPVVQPCGPGAGAARPGPGGARTP